MPLMKRATAVIQAAGIDLEVRKGMYGYWLSNPHFRCQRGSIVYKTVKDVILAAMRGEKPEEVLDQPPTQPK